MIVVTRLNDSQFAINPDLIERIHANPDTTLVMVDGAKYIVTESMGEVIERIAAYRARVIALAYEPQSATQRVRQLGLVTSSADDSAFEFDAATAAGGGPAVRGSSGPASETASLHPLAALHVPKSPHPLHPRRK